MHYAPSRLRGLALHLLVASTAVSLSAFAALGCAGDPSDTGDEQDSTSTAGVISPAGAKLATLLDGMGVTTAWQPVTSAQLQLVNWETGLAVGNVAPQPDCMKTTESALAGDTFCSSFVSAIVWKAGKTLATAAVPFLHPYNSDTAQFGADGQCAKRDYLSNYQQDWLKGLTVSLPKSWSYTPPKNTGWTAVAGNSMQTAQTLANAGNLVVASYKFPSTPTQPGHITMVRPSTKTATLVASQGPDVISAGTHNYATTSLQQAFAIHSCLNNTHPNYCGNDALGTPNGAWESMSSTNPKILFFSHALP